MRAVVCRKFGGIEALKVEDVPPPDLTPGSVRIEVHAAGVGFANLLVVEGKHQNRPDPPFTPGTEIAGIVTDAADDVEDLAPGQRVVAGVEQGGYAEQAVSPDVTVYPLPDGLTFADAVHFPSIYATAYGALLWRADVRPGDTLLILGAGGASGLAAVDIGTVRGARVIAAASTREKIAAARRHGADEGIDTSRSDLRAEVLALTGGRGADVVFDPVGGDLFDAALRCTAPEGRIVVTGFAAGRIPDIPANLPLVKNVTISGLNWGYYMGWGKTKTDAAGHARVRVAMQRLFAWHAEGRLTPECAGLYALTDFAQAMRAVAERRTIGKPVLLPQT